jgi:hypothetical protein
MARAEHLVILTFALAVTVVWSVWLWIMLVMPRRWSAFVEWENAMWVRTGLFPESWSTKVKAMETGVTLKVLVALGIVMSMAILFKA